MVRATQSPARIQCPPFTPLPHLTLDVNLTLATTLGLIKGTELHEGYNSFQPSYPFFNYKMSTFKF